MYYVDPDGATHRIGGTKIGRFGLKPAKLGEDRGPGHRDPDPPSRFTALGEEFFSLGQDTSFYEALTEIGGPFREKVLKALRDVAYDQSLLSLAEVEEVTRVSLLREVPLTTVRDQFARLARGGARLTPYRFSFSNKSHEQAPFKISFSVDPHSRPPSNIQVLIGRNGVGKSTLLNKIATAMVEGSRTKPSHEERDQEAGPKQGGPWVQLSNVVSVSFSAFDAFEPEPSALPTTTSV